MNKILFSFFLICSINFTAKSQTLNCSYYDSILPPDSVYAAFSELNSFYESGSDGGISFSSTFGVLYLSIKYQNYGLDQNTWGDILVCAAPTNINLSDTILTSCDTVAIMGLSIKYALPPPRSGDCYPAWVYNSLLPSLAVSHGDTSVYQFNRDLNSCGFDSIAYCSRRLNDQCDSVASILGVYNIMLYNENVRADTALMDNVYSFLYNGSFLPYKTILSEINNCNPNDTAVLTQIVYSARNLSYTTDSLGNYYMDFEVFASDTPANLLYSQSQIFIQYDSTIFGSNIVSNGKITASKGNVIDSPYYNLTLADSLPNLLQISITHTPSPASLTNLDSVNQQLCHLKINLSGFNLSAVAAAFDTIAMAGRSEYKRTIYGLEFPYDIIRVSGLVAAPQYAELAYDLTGFSTTLSSGYLAFYLTARSAPPSSYSDGQIIIDYDTLAFGSYVAHASNYSYSVISYNDALTVSDYSASQLLININNVTSQTTFDAVSNTPDSLFLFFLLITDCTSQLE